MDCEARPRPRRPALAIMAAVAVLAVSLSACAAPDPLAQQARAGDNKNYIAGDGSVSEYTSASRQSAVTFQAPLFNGQTVESRSFQGKVTVLNFWYAACGPCRLEARDLQALSQSLQAEGAQFYGVNIRDEVPTATAYERTFGVTYPSFYDRNGGVLLAMASFVPPQAVPTTLVLDKQGRVAARILGVADKSTLKALITETLAS
ncbi:TlpA disulfide reductase family protein [Arthrobacter sp. UYEF20]|uniref:TlpA family protein disulfide reductase n=1 Tax=Arthrobacter sp. UYEF20 TaxID=1756363 RepID=UPI0033945B92